MGRYDNVPLKINRKGQRVLVATLYPQIPLTDEDQFIRPKDGDRLDNLAYRYYNDASLWWVIAKANGLGKGRIVTNPSVELRIPGNIAYIIAEFNALNE